MVDFCRFTAFNETATYAFTVMTPKRGVGGNPALSGNESGCAPGSYVKAYSRGSAQR